MKQRIQKIIAASGHCSRRAAEVLIDEGRVRLNGEICLLGDTAEDGDTITIDNKPLTPPGGRTYIMLNKPRGYVTTMSDERGRKNVSDLVSDAGARVFPVGRLDLDSEGLLIMTDDGFLANRLMHPSHEVPKTYLALVRGENIPDAVEKLRLPMFIDDAKINPAKVQLKSSDEKGTLLSITITQGKNRQIRKMCAQSGLRVLRLKRISEGTLKLGNLPVGKWRYLHDDEIENLQSL